MKISCFKFSLIRENSHYNSAYYFNFSLFPEEENEADQDSDCYIGRERSAIIPTKNGEIIVAIARAL